MKKLLTLLLFYVISQHLFGQTGNLDRSFKSGSGADGTVFNISVFPDNKILITGSFENYNGTSRKRIAKLNEDGMLDLSFDMGSGVYGGGIECAIIQADGKIIIGGSFYANNGSIKNICRLNSNGSIDTSFFTGTSTDGAVTTLLPQPDGKIILAGFFNKYNGVTRNRILRLNIDGTLDESFDSGEDFKSVDARQPGVKSMVIQSDGKIVVVGYFKSINNVLKNNIARLNSDGSLDNVFSSGTGTSDVVNQIIKLTDGKFIIVGSFNFYNNTSANGIARLNANGTFDNTYKIGKGIGDNQFYIFSITSAHLLSNNKLMIGGTFSKFNDIIQNNLARLNADGTLDVSFKSGEGTDKNGLGIGSPIYAIAAHLGNKVLIGGDFSKYNDTNAVAITRIYNDEIAPTGLESLASKNVALVLYPNPTSDFLQIKANHNLQEINMLNLNGQLVQDVKDLNKNEITLPVSQLPKGIYFIQVTVNDVTSITKFIRE